MSIKKKMTFKEKYSDLISFLRDSESAALAFSGGVDSSFLLYAMKMSGMKALAVTGVSEKVPKWDLQSSRSFAEVIGVEYIAVETEELMNEDFVNNSPERCFFCKDELFRKIRAVAEENNCSLIFDGSNVDDLDDFRPGLRAAALHGVRSPLAEFKFTKNDVRSMLKELRLNIWDRASSPCLSSRFPYGQRITLQALLRVGKSEEFLRSFGISDIRVRSHGDTGRIEVNERDMHILVNPENRRLITETLKSFGFRYVSLDLEGFRSGSMNRTIDGQVARWTTQDKR